MKRACYLWLGLAVLSCATEENTLPLGAASGGTASTEIAGTAGTGGDGSGASSVGGGESGSSAVGGTENGGAGGTFSTAGSGGTEAGTAGTAGGGGTAAGTGGSSGGASGGTGGMGGKAGSGGTAGSGGIAGSGGTAGSGGSGGGAATVKCGDHAIPAKGQWTATASSECAPTCADPNGPYTAALAVDGNDATRFSSGQPEVGGEWFQIDLGALATVNHVSLNTVPVKDFTRHYQVRVSSTANDMGAAVLADGDGMAGISSISLSKTVNGRYVLISQTGVSPDASWWSVNEIDVTCQ